MAALIALLPAPLAYLDGRDGETVGGQRLHRRVYTLADDPQMFRATLFARYGIASVTSSIACLACVFVAVGLKVNSTLRQDS